MNNELLEYMLKTKKTDYALFFLSSDFFESYWNIFLNNKFEYDSISKIKNIARNSIYNFINQDLEYWDYSDFSDVRRRYTWVNFVNSVAKECPYDFERLDLLSWQLVLPSQKTSSIDFCLSLIHRIRNDNTFRILSDCTASDANIIQAAYEKFEVLDINPSEIRRKWEYNEIAFSSWDLWLKKVLGNTNSVVSNTFDDAINNYTVLPKIVQNIKILHASKNEYINFVQRFKHVYEKERPADASLELPEAFFV